MALDMRPGSTSFTWGSERPAARRSNRLRPAAIMREGKEGACYGSGEILTVSSIPITNHDASDPSGSHLEPPANDSQNWLSRWKGSDDSRGMRCRDFAGCWSHGPQPFAVIDLDRRIVLSNRAFSELVGYSRDELLGMSIMDLTAPQSLEVTRRSHAEVLATGQERASDQELSPQGRFPGSGRADHGRFP